MCATAILSTSLNRFSFQILHVHVFIGVFASEEGNQGNKGVLRRAYFSL